VTDSARPDLLFARLQLRVPAARSILFASPRNDVDTSALADEVAGAIIATGSRARVLHAEGGATGHHEGGPERMEVLESELTDLDRARRALQWPVGFTVASAPGVLENSTAIVLSAAVDVVVLVAKRGKTVRSDLVQAREDIEGAGGSVAGSVLLP
jgi:hypothetical protein